MLGVWFFAVGSILFPFTLSRRVSVSHSAYPVGPADTFKGVRLTTDLHAVPKLKMHGALPAPCSMSSLHDAKLGMGTVYVYPSLT